MFLSQLWGRPQALVKPPQSWEKKHGLSLTPTATIHSSNTLLVDISIGETNVCAGAPPIERCPPVMYEECMASA